MMLSLSGVDAFYGRSHALHQVSVSVPAGQITAVLGRNGVGKTTLLKVLIGLMERVSGVIRFGGDDITRMPAHRRALPFSTAIRKPAARWKPRSASTSPVPPRRR